jgi:AcrR family transcriptional regulator
MARKSSTPAKEGPQRATHGMPVQKRSRERFEMILNTAEGMLRENGGDAFKMSELVAKSGVPFGSLFQYFPDKTAVIAALAERYNSIGHDCVSTALHPVTNAETLRGALREIVDGYYDMFQRHPALTAIWEATQADRVLLRLDREDGDYLAGMLAETLARVVPGFTPASARTIARLAMELIASAVRHSITLEKAEAAVALTAFNNGLWGFVVGGRDDTPSR